MIRDVDDRGIGVVQFVRREPVDEQSAEVLATRTLTELYNQQPTWLRDVHRALDEAVFAAYGWPADLAADEVLTRLLDLNIQRAEEEARR